MVHPNIVQYMFDAFNCTSIGDDNRVKNDLQIQCWAGSHMFWGLALAIPSIMVWGLGIPCFAIIILSKEKDKLAEFTTMEKYGFLYRGYKKNFYFW